MEPISRNADAIDLLPWPVAGLAADGRLLFFNAQFARLLPQSGKRGAESDWDALRAAHPELEEPVLRARAGEGSTAVRLSDEAGRSGTRIQACLVPDTPGMLLLLGDRMRAGSARREQLETALERISSAVCRQEEPEAVIDELLRIMVDAHLCDSAALYLEEAGRWKLRFMHGLPETLRGATLSLSEPESAACRAVSINDAARIATRVPDLAGQKVEALLEIGLEVAAGQRARLALYRHTPGARFGPPAARFLERAAGIVTLALRSDRLHCTTRAVREECALFSVLFERSTQPFFIGRPDGSTVRVNDAFCRLLGYTAAELRNFHWERLTPPEYLPRQRALLAELDRTGTPQRFEKEFLRKDGNRVPVEIVVHVVPDDQGRPLYRLVFSTDISERRRTLAALRDSEERFRTVFDAGPMGMVLVGPDLTIHRANTTFRSHLGCAPGELEGRSIYDLTHPDDRDSQARALRQLRSGELGRYDMDKRYLRADGGVVWVQETCSVVRDGQGGSYFVVMTDDVTSRKAAEAALRRSENLMRVVLDTIPIGVWVTDVEGNLFLSNPAARAIWGGERNVRRGDYSVFRAWWPTGHRPLDPGEWPILRVIDRGEQVLEEELEIEAFDGTRKVVLNSALPFYEEGHVSGALMTTLDVTERQRLMVELRESRDFLERVMNSITNAVIVVDRRAFVVRTNRAAATITGYPLERLVGRSWWELLGDEDRADAESRFARLLTGEPIGNWVMNVNRSDGALRLVTTNVHPLRANGVVTGAVATAEDNTERILAEQALRDSEARLSAILLNAPAVIFMLDAEGRLQHANRRFELLLGLKTEEVRGKRASEVLPAELAEQLEANSRIVMESDMPLEFEEVIPQPSGARIFSTVKAALRDAQGRAYGLVGISTDITDRKRMEEEIRHLAHHDVLTGLPNRRLFTDLLERELAQARRNHGQVALLFLDLDRFKSINDTLGHEAGDALLRQVAERLRERVRRSDVVARVGGDEFNLILPEVASAERAADVARDLVAAFERPFSVAGQQLYVSTSIGISLSPSDSEEAETLLRYADIAMYHAKQLGRGGFQFFNQQINVRSMERLRLENELRGALGRNELRVFYQPQVAVEGGRVLSAEALVRWAHPQKGLLEPAAFVPMAEEIGIITEIDQWVLRRACEEARRWSDRHGAKAPGVTVNLSAKQFLRSDLPNLVTEVVRLSGIDARRLELEITESVAMGDITLALPQMRRIAAMGVRLAIDDFGTGYSSLSYLKRMPVDRLKIDQSFVRDIATDTDDRAIVVAVSDLAHNMQMRVVAEGVETEDQLALLHESQCDEAQGFLFAQPLDAERMRARLTVGEG